MSKRFGRNQRRRAREAIANLTHTVEALELSQESDRALLRHTSDSLAVARKEIEDAKRIAGRMSILFPAVTQRVSMPLGDRDRWSVESTPAYWLGDDTLSARQAETLTRLDLPLLLSRIDSDQLAQRVHCSIRFSDHRVVYAVDERSLLCMPRDVRGRTLAKHIAEGLASEMSRQITRNR